MKTSNNIITYASKADYLNRTPTKSALQEAGKKVGEKLAGKVADRAVTKPGVNPAEQKGIVRDGVNQAKEDVKSKVKDKVSEVGEAGKHLLSQAGGAILRNVGGSVLSTIGIKPPSIEISTASEPKELKDAEKVAAKINKPGIFFVEGLSLNPFGDSEDGLSGMAKNIPSSQVFNWNDTTSIIEAIESRPHSQPILLIGHGMGSDTAVEVANKMNSVEHGFRRIDLLVTLDSIGTDNDIIPQNVRENYNLITDQDTLFNDGPNVAKRKNQTKVENTLLEKSHSELETDPEVQFLVFEKISRTLMNAVTMKKVRENLGQKLMDSHRLSSRVANLSQ